MQCSKARLVYSTYTHEMHGSLLVTCDEGSELISVIGNVYRYTAVYLCLQTYIYIYVYKHSHICIYIYIYIYIYIHVYTCVNTYVYVYGRMTVKMTVEVCPKLLSTWAHVFDRDQSGFTTSST